MYVNKGLSYLDVCCVLIWLDVVCMASEISERLRLVMKASDGDLPYLPLTLNQSDRKELLVLPTRQQH